jgi:heptosyltransferase-2
MNDDSRTDPLLLVPYAWIGDYVRAHSVVKLLRARWPGRPVDILSTSLCAPLVDYMPGARKAIVWDLPRSRIALRQQRALAARMKAEGYGTAIVMPRTWKSALAPFLAGIPERTGFVGEARFGLLTDLRWGERRLPRMIDHFGALALPKGAPLPNDWPLPELVVPQAERERWLAERGLQADARPVVTVGPGAVGAGKAWPVGHYAQLARRLTAAGVGVWVIGSPKEAPLAAEIAAAGGPAVKNLTGTDLRNAIVALASADAAVSNDSGLMHIAAALGTPTIAIFGPTSPWHWAPLNPLAAVLEPPEIRPCPACGRQTCDDVRHRRTADVAPERVHEAVERVLTSGRSPSDMRPH